MAKTPEDSENSVITEGPDHFSFYTGEVKNLVSENDDGLPFSTELNGSGEGGLKSEKSSGSLFGNSVGCRLSDQKKQLLNSLLRQSLEAFSPEADDMLDPVLRMNRLKAQLEKRKMGIKPESAAGQKDPSSVSSDIPISSSGSSQEVDDDLQILLDSDISMVEESLKKYSDQLFGQLSHMEKQIEEQLDTVVSTCRTMAPSEKRILQKLIQKLPPKNLNRVAEIIQRTKPQPVEPSGEIMVDLEREDNTTLWRLYYYVEAVDKAKKLSS